MGKVFGYLSFLRCAFGFTGIRFLVGLSVSSRCGDVSRAV